MYWALKSAVEFKADFLQKAVNQAWAYTLTVSSVNNYQHIYLVY